MNKEFQKYLDEALPNVDITPKPSKFKITIEEHICGVFEIEAMDIGEAMEIAKQKYDSGEFVVDAFNVPNIKLMMAEDELSGETTEWEEF